MDGGIAGTLVPVSCADGSPDGADGGGRGALLDALGKVGGYVHRIGGQHLVPWRPAHSAQPFHAERGAKSCARSSLPNPMRRLMK